MVAERTVIRADAQRAFQPETLPHEWRELLLDALQFGGILFVRVFLGRKFFRVGVIAGIHAHDLDPLHRFHGGFGLEMDVGHNRHVAVLPAQFRHDVL